MPNPGEDDSSKPTTPLELSPPSDDPSAPWWHGAPIAVTIASAIFGLLGTGVGALLQGYANTSLERQKFEFALIEKAVDTKDKAEAAKNLAFLASTGAIRSLNAQKIAELAKPATVPSVGGCDKDEYDKAVMERNNLRAALDAYNVSMTACLRETERLRVTLADAGVPTPGVPTSDAGPDPD